MLIQRYVVIAHVPPGADPTGRSYTDTRKIFSLPTRHRIRAGFPPLGPGSANGRARLVPAQHAVSIREPHPPPRKKILEIERRLTKRARPIRGRSAAISQIRPFTGRNAELFLASICRPLRARESTACCTLPLMRGYARIPVA